MTLPIPFTWVGETRPGYPCKAFRWAFRIEWGTIELVAQHCYADGRWHGSHTDRWAIDVAAWRVGVDHFWWDGPHCVYRLGFLAFQRYNPNCAICYGVPDEPA